MKIEVEIPFAEAALDAATMGRLQKDLLQTAILRLFGERRISSLEARKQLGMARVAFMELARKRGVPMYDYTAENWEQDKKTLDLLHREIVKNLKQPSARRLK